MVEQQQHGQHILRQYEERVYTRFFAQRFPRLLPHAFAKQPDLDETLLVLRCSHFVRTFFGFLIFFFRFTSVIVPT